MAFSDNTSRCHVWLGVAVLLGTCLKQTLTDEIWQQDLTSDIKIGLAETGYKRVQLKCGAEYMQVIVNTDDDFSGVIYTRGSFYERKKPCFKDAKAGKKFTLKIPFDSCHTKKEDEVYSNVIVLQYDDHLIMPGDAAFTVECDFSKPRDVHVEADLGVDKESAPAPASTSTSSTARISLADADPAGKELPKHRRSTVDSNTGTVNFTPDDIRPRKKRKKDEL